MALEASLSVPAEFKLSKAIRDELPENEKADAREKLWAKSGGKCSLCDEALPPDGKLVDIDHMTPRKHGAGGETKLSNLYVAHSSCNRSRKNLPYGLASSVIRFAKWCAAHPRRSFDDVINTYIPGGGMRAKIHLEEGEVQLDFGSDERRADLYDDPATGTQYFFMNVPVSYIQNDEDTQPRFIEHDHVRTLATDFTERPVHEPSNCRLITIENGLADLRQFDGQHKTTAQVILGRTEIPMKIYLNPDQAMIQELVVQIQQGIKKRPLSTTDTLKKLDDVIQDRVAAYKLEHGGESPSEIELVAAQPLQDQTAFKKRLLSNFEFAVLNDDSLQLRKYISTKADRNSPLTDRVLVAKIIKPLICQELLDSKLDNSIARETERDAVVQFLNRVTENMLTDKWRPKPRNADEDLATRRARLFFQQGAVSWWLKSIFLPTFQSVFLRQRWKKLFVEPLSDVQQERLDGYLDIVCGWEVWSTTDEKKIAAFRSNTVSNVESAVPEHSNLSLQHEFS